MVKLSNIKIPEDASAEGRQILEGINRVIEEVNREVERNDDLPFTEEANILRRLTLAKSEGLLERINNLNSELPQYGLEFILWPELIGDDEDQD